MLMGFQLVDDSLIEEVGALPAWFSRNVEILRQLDCRGSVFENTAQNLLRRALGQTKKRNVFGTGRGNIDYYEISEIQKRCEISKVTTEEQIDLGKSRHCRFSSSHSLSDSCDSDCTYIQDDNMGLLTPTSTTTSTPLSQTLASTTPAASSDDEDKAEAEAQINEEVLLKNSTVSQGAAASTPILPFDFAMSQYLLRRQRALLVQKLRILRQGAMYIKHEHARILQRQATQCNAVAESTCSASRRLRSSTINHINARSTNTGSTGRYTTPATKLSVSSDKAKVEHVELVRVKRKNSMSSNSGASSLTVATRRHRKSAPMSLITKKANDPQKATKLSMSLGWSRDDFDQTPTKSQPQTFRSESCSSQETPAQALDTHLQRSIKDTASATFEEPRPPQNSFEPLKSSLSHLQAPFGQNQTESATDPHPLYAPLPHPTPTMLKRLNSSETPLNYSELMKGSDTFSHLSLPLNKSKTNAGSTQPLLHAIPAQTSCLTIPIDSIGRSTPVPDYAMQFHHGLSNDSGSLAPSSLQKTTPIYMCSSQLNALPILSETPATSSTSFITPMLHTYQPMIPQMEANSNISVSSLAPTSGPISAPTLPKIAARSISLQAATSVSNSQAKKSNKCQEKYISLVAQELTPTQPIKNSSETTQNDVDAEWSGMCPVCGQGENAYEGMVACDSCNDWFHFVCVGYKQNGEAAAPLNFITNQKVKKLKKQHIKRTAQGAEIDDNWYCQRCISAGRLPESASKKLLL